MQNLRKFFETEQNRVYRNMARICSDLINKFGSFKNTENTKSAMKER